MCYFYSIIEPFYSLSSSLNKNSNIAMMMIEIANNFTLESLIFIKVKVNLLNLDLQIQNNY